MSIVTTTNNLVYLKLYKENMIIPGLGPSTKKFLVIEIGIRRKEYKDSSP